MVTLGCLTLLLSNNESHLQIGAALHAAERQ